MEEIIEEARILVFNTEITMYEALQVAVLLKKNRILESAVSAIEQAYGVGNYFGDKGARPYLEAIAMVFGFKPHSNNETIRDTLSDIASSFSDIASSLSDLVHNTNNGKQ